MIVNFTTQIRIYANLYLVLNDILEHEGQFAIIGGDLKTKNK